MTGPLALARAFICCGVNMPGISGMEPISILPMPLMSCPFMAE